MRKGENPSEVLAALKARVDTLNTSMLPAGVTIVPFYDRTWLIGTTLQTVFTNLLEGAALVTVVLFVFLGSLRAVGDRGGDDPAVAARDLHRAHASAASPRTCCRWARWTSGSSSTAR